eukprot:scaffold450_cov347-Pavlova_lutheri.AAC.2
MARPSLRPPRSVFLSPRVLVPRFPSLPSHEWWKRLRVQHAQRSTPVRGCPAPASRGWSVAVRSAATSVFPSSLLPPYPGTEKSLRDSGITHFYQDPPWPWRWIARLGQSEEEIRSIGLFASVSMVEGSILA